MYDRRAWWIRSRDGIGEPGFVPVEREFQLGVNGRYEISTGLKRNALSNGHTNHS